MDASGVILKHFDMHSLVVNVIHGDACKVILIIVTTLFLLLCIAIVLLFIGGRNVR
jgi:hypothetical protein